MTKYQVLVGVLLYSYLSNITIADDAITQPFDMYGMKMCPSGYRLDGSLCRKFYVPPNAYPVFGDWQCSVGFKRVGDHCDKVEIPANAMPSFNGWVCKVGYNEVNGKCIPKSWDELNNDAEYYVRKLIDTKGACEKVCDDAYYGEKKRRCKEFCDGKVQRLSE